MSYYSDVAFSFTKPNWERFLDESKKQSPELQKELDWLLRSAKVNEDHPDGKHHVVYWSYAKWYEYDPDSVGSVKFFERKGRELANEYMRIGEDGEYEFDTPEDDEGVLGRDGDEIWIEGITLSRYQKGELLTSVWKAFVKAAPEAADKWAFENEKKYGCDEFDKLFEEA